VLALSAISLKAPDSSAHSINSPDRAVAFQVPANGLIALLRCMTIAPKVAVGDGALGFWKALPQVFGETRFYRQPPPSAR